MPNILLVEDDPFISDIYSRAIAQAGYQVDIAIDGEMAIEKAITHTPDLMVLDIILPKKDGWEVLRDLRDNPKTKTLKVIVISNLDKKDNQENIEVFKVSKYFLKIESTPKEITNAIGQILNT
jgi:DNA-binding response OmpR family regulator